MAHYKTSSYTGFTERLMRRGCTVALACVTSGCAGALPVGDGGFAGIVSSASPEATAAGVEILERGGNAVDAAVAVSIALGVSEPAGSGIGGQVMMLLQKPGEVPIVILGTSHAPKKLPSGIQSQDLVGHRAATVPSAVKTLDLAMREYGGGRVTWRDALAPAIQIAEKGFALGHFRHASTARYARALARDAETRRVFLTEAGEAPRRGSTVVRPKLAGTLRRLAEAGATDFYAGEIAAAIAEDMAANGGWITADDLRDAPKPRVVPAIAGTYRGYDVYSLPPPAGGWVVLQALNILECADPSALTERSPERSLWLASALSAVHHHRLEFPVPSLQRYDAAIRQRTSKEFARKLVDSLELHGSGETTHFCVVDGEGTAVSVTQSLNSYFGAKVMAGDLGFLYNDYMREFEVGVEDHPDHPFALRPGAMPYSSMSATILSKDGRPVLLAGSPGSRRIISAVVQVISGWVDAGRSIDRSTSAPRIHVVPEDDDLHFERAPTSAAEIRQLELRGFHMSVPISSLYRASLNPYFGGVHALALERGVWRGGADPRRDGTVGYARRQ